MLKEYFKDHCGLVLFFIIIVSCVGVCTWRYHASKSHFEESCERICQRHQALCNNFPVLTQTLHKDSVIVINPDILAHIQTHDVEIRDMLELQHHEIEEDFSTLTLWASVLMIVFLVFSIYSMYRVDELVNQSRSSTRLIEEHEKKVREHAGAAQTKISEIDKLFDKESEKLTEQSTKEIEAVRIASQEKLKEFNQQVDSQFQAFEQRIKDAIDLYSKAIEDRAKNVEDQLSEMESFQKVFKHILSAASPKLESEDQTTDLSKHDEGCESDKQEKD